MTVLRPSRGCSPRNAADNDNDGFMGCDTAPPDPAAQRRGHKAVIALMIVAGIAAIVTGLVQGVQGIVTAFPVGHSIFELASWVRFFAALGQLASVGLALVAAALIWHAVIHNRRA